MCGPQRRLAPRHHQAGLLLRELHLWNTHTGHGVSSAPRGGCTVWGEGTVCGLGSTACAIDRSVASAARRSC